MKSKILKKLNMSTYSPKEFHNASVFNVVGLKINLTFKKE
jgi:hypothetical protein